MTRREFLATAAAAGTASFLFTPAVLSDISKSRTGSNPDNLMAGYDRECFARGAYTIFAEKADEEGYAPAASMFRALAQAEMDHANLFATELKKLNIKPKATSKLPEPKSTFENLQTAVAVETAVSDVEFPAYEKKANEEGARSAARVFELCLNASKIHAQLCKDAAQNLSTLKSSKKAVYYVCPKCGNIVKEADYNFKRCPLCGAMEQFVKMT